MGILPMKIRVLVICEHNSARSQMVAAYLKRFAGDRLEVESAGFEPAEKVNPLVVEAMLEEGIDLSANRPKSVFELFKQGRLYDHVITVCGEGEEKCPIFPGITKRWHMPFTDPSSVTGTYEERIEQVRRIRDEIKEAILNPPPGGFDFRKLI
jgi:arsenate reductase